MEVLLCSTTVFNLANVLHQLHPFDLMGKVYVLQKKNLNVPYILQNSSLININDARATRKKYAGS